MDCLLSLFNKWLVDTRCSVNLLVLQESALHCSMGLAVLLLPAALLSFWLSVVTLAFNLLTRENPRWLCTSCKRKGQ